MVPVGVLVMLAIIYTGFVIPIPYMKPWLGWFRHVNPVAYAFESLMINEFQGRSFGCARFIPDGEAYQNVSDDFKSCVGTAVAFQSDSVNGDEYIKSVYKYSPPHLWRNVGIIFAFIIFFGALHLWSSEFVETRKPRGDLLLFLRNATAQGVQIDEELNISPVPKTNYETHISSDAGLIKHKSTIHWENVSYEVPLKKGETKEILNNIDGWVKPGTLTVLMGATGAGKTTLLDVIAQRTTSGTITGEIMVDGRPRDNSFQRSTGYAQQNDLHLHTATVREALRFSARLRQPKRLPNSIKYAYVEKIIDILGMKWYADAIVGEPGDGLSPEQRKRLTIAVELAARPSRLLFLDEPTSGLDSQTAFIICNLLRNLAHESGQAIMCTIHQPSSRLLEMFDQMLLIDEGHTVYFGPIGPDVNTMINYFESKGAPACRRGQNPAEWVMDVSGASPGSKNTIDWHTAWQNSTERQQLKHDLSRMKETLARQQISDTESGEFATPIWTQFFVVTYRTFVEYWRTPSAIYAKLMFYFGASFMIGVSCFRSPNSLQGLQNQLFSVFLIFTTFSNVLQQIAPQFGARRALFEAREAPSKIFSWAAFISSSIIVEAAWQVLLATISFVLFYYLTGMNHNASDADRHERGILMLLLFIAFFLFTQSLSHLLAVAIEVPQAAVNMGQPVFYLTIIFCGVLVPKEYLPRFWIFMYWVSPLTYLTRSIFTVGVAKQPITCMSSELVMIPKPPNSQTCGDFLDTFIGAAGGRVLNPSARDKCQYCPMKDTDQFLHFFSMSYQERWRDFVIIFIYIVFNWLATFALYKLVRVPKRQKPLKNGKDKSAV
jgi:ABC-type multidrug transport system permease subunit